MITINSGSLPTGIISTCDATNYKIPLRFGDVVVILSDGVTDVFRNEKAIPELLKMVDTSDMKKLADGIMDQALKKIIRPHDDMTVICARVQ